MADATTPSATYKVRSRTATVEPYGLVTKEGARGSCVLLHGWGSIGSDMGPLCVALRNLPSAAGWNFYTATYETHLASSSRQPPPYVNKPEHVLSRGCKYVGSMPR